MVASPRNHLDLLGKPGAPAGLFAGRIAKLEDAGQLTVLTPSEALDVANKAIAAAHIDPQEYAEAEVAEVTATCLEHIREGLVGMAAQ